MIQYIYHNVPKQQFFLNVIIWQLYLFKMSFQDLYDIKHPTKHIKYFGNKSNSSDSIFKLPREILTLFQSNLDETKLNIQYQPKKKQIFQYNRHQLQLRRTQKYKDSTNFANNLSNKSQSSKNSIILLVNKTQQQISQDKAKKLINIQIRKTNSNYHTHIFYPQKISSYFKVNAKKISGVPRIQTPTKKKTKKYIFQDKVIKHQKIKYCRLSPIQSKKYIRQQTHENNYLKPWQTQQDGFPS